MNYHIAQINIADLLHPKGHPQVQSFFDAIDEINVLGESSPGFVWRLKDGDNNATEIRYNDNPLLIVNMTVWESIDALHQFTYYSDHARIYRQRRDWFHVMKTSYFGLWYVPAGTEPTIEDAREHLEYMDKHGATPFAFNFKQRFTLEDYLSYKVLTNPV
jgi:hypothetical protein